MDWLAVIGWAILLAVAWGLVALLAFAAYGVYLLVS